MLLDSPMLLSYDVYILVMKLKLMLKMEVIWYYSCITQQVQTFLAASSQHLDLTYVGRKGMILHFCTQNVIFN